MQKYKLIKEYPESSKLGTLAYKKEGYGDIIVYLIDDNREVYISSSKPNYFENTIVNHPEFWEIVKE